MRSRVSDVPVVAGALLLIAAFLPWYGLDSGVFATGGGEGGSSVSAWEASPAWWVPVLAGVVLGVLWLLRRRGFEAPWLPAVTVAVGVIGLVLVLAQLLQGVTATGGDADFGWYAYAPLSEDAVPSPGPRAGLLLGLGALLLQTGAAAVVLRRAGGSRAG